MLWYLDTSALTKLVATEQESFALRAWLQGRTITTSELAYVELIRAARRYSEEYVRRAEEVLAEVDMVVLNIDVLTTAAALLPLELRSLDAVHVASALHLGSACEGIVTYDRRMQEAARLAGLAVESPGVGPD